jgi:hypothetical protein
MASPWSSIDGEYECWRTVPLPILGLDRGLSKNRSSAPDFDALRHNMQKIGLCLFRESNAPENTAALSAQFIAIAKAPCQAFTSVKGKKCFTAKNAPAFRPARSIL